MNIPNGIGKASNVQDAGLGFMGNLGKGKWPIREMSMPEFCGECNTILIHPSEGPYCSSCQSRGRPSKYNIDEYAERMNKTIERTKMNRREGREIYVRQISAMLLAEMIKTYQGKAIDIREIMKDLEKRAVDSARRLLHVSEGY